MEDVARVMVVAAEQHGAVGLSQLDGLGLGRRQRLRALHEGWLIAVASGVYVVAGSVDSVERRLHTGLLRLGPDAVVSHEAAARLHRFDRTPPDAVQFTVPRAARGGGTGLRVHSTETFGPTDRLRVDGFPCTSATRTIIDLARIGRPRSRVEAAIDSAVRSGASSPIVLANRLAELRGTGWRGARLIDALLPDSGGHSPLERRFLRLIRTAGLPRPTTQVIHRLGTRTIARVDFCFEDHDVVVEVSGRLGHVSDADRARDAQRRNELQAAGRHVIEFTRTQVEDRPIYVLDILRAALTSHPIEG